MDAPGWRKLPIILVTSLRRQTATVTNRLHSFNFVLTLKTAWDSRTQRAGHDLQSWYFFYVCFWSGYLIIGPSVFRANTEEVLSVSILKASTPILVEAKLYSRRGGELLATTSQEVFGKIQDILLNGLWIFHDCQTNLIARCYGQMIK